MDTMPTEVRGLLGPEVSKMVHDWACSHACSWEDALILLVVKGLSVSMRELQQQPLRMVQ